MGAAFILLVVGLILHPKPRREPAPPLPASIGQRIAGVKAPDEAPRAVGCWHNPRTYEAPYIASGEAWVRLHGGDCR